MRRRASGGGLLGRCLLWKGRTAGSLLAAALLICSTGCVVFSPSYEPSSSITNAAAAIESVGEISETRRWIALLPEGQEAKPGSRGKLGAGEGLIVYPGANVSPRAYLPLFDRIVARGYTVYILKMPFDLAVLDSDRALAVIERRKERTADGDVPALRRWHIAGHSLGGAMAARLVDRHPGRFATLTLLAAYPPEGVDIRGRSIAVLSVYGSRDGVADIEAILTATEQYPPDAEFLEIDGGNHAQFGIYGMQEGDEPARISGARQRRITQTAMLELFGRAVE